MNKTVEQAVEDVKGDIESISGYCGECADCLYYTVSRGYFWDHKLMPASHLIEIGTKVEVEKAAAEWKAKQGKEWVDGLPPINSEIEVLPEPHSRYYSAVVVGYDGDTVICRMEDDYPNSAYDGFTVALIRPTTSDRDKAIEEMAQSCQYPNSHWTKMVCKELFDLGYRKQMSREDAEGSILSVLNHPAYDQLSNDNLAAELVDALGFDQ